jgi:hypothetical protein
MAVGEAAGVAVAYSLENAISFRDMSESGEAIHLLQESLKEQGAYLVKYDPPRPAVMEHWAYPGVKVMRELGLAAGGYTNDYRLDAPIQYWDADFMLGRVLKRVEELKPGLKVTEVSFPQDMTRADLIQGISQVINSEKLSLDKAITLLQRKGIITADIEEQMGDMQLAPTFGELYMLLAKIYEVLLN